MGKQMCFKVVARLPSNLVYGSNGVRPGAREQNWLACWRLAQSRQRLRLTASRSLEDWRTLPHDGGSTSAYDRKGGEAIYLY